MSRATIVAAVAVLMAGCSSVVRQPQVRLDGIRVGGIGLTGGTLYAQVHVTNPNGFDLETEALSYELELEHPDSVGQWVSFSRGTVDEPLRVQSNGSTVIEVPIQFRYSDAGGAVRSLIRTGTFNYRVRGEVDLSEPIGRTFPYSRTGTVSLTGARE